MPKNNEPSGVRAQKSRDSGRNNKPAFMAILLCRLEMGVVCIHIRYFRSTLCFSRSRRNKRPVENSVARLGLFQQRGTSNAEIENAFNNTVTGAAAIYDWLVPGSNGPK